MKQAAPKTEDELIEAFKPIKESAYTLHAKTIKRLAVAVRGDMLYIEVPILPRLSSTGKRMVLASTDGSHLVDCSYAGKGMRIMVVATCTRD